MDIGPLLYDNPICLRFTHSVNRQPKTIHRNFHCAQSGSVSVFSVTIGSRLVSARTSPTAVGGSTWPPRRLGNLLGQRPVAAGIEQFAVERRTDGKAGRGGDRPALVAIAGGKQPIDFGPGRLDAIDSAGQTIEASDVSARSGIVGR